MKRGIFIITILLVVLTWIGLANALEGELQCTVRSVPGVTNASIQISNYNDKAAAGIKRIFIYNMEGNLICDGPWGDLRDPIPPNGGTWFSVNYLIDKGWCPKVEFTVDGWLLMRIIWETKGKTPLPLKRTSISP